MKIVTKLLLASLVLVLAGGILFLVAFAGSGWRFPSSYSAKDELYVENAGEEIYRIELDLTNEDIRVVYGDVFSVSYQDVYSKEGTLHRAIVFEREGSVLKIDALQIKHWRLFSFDYPDVNITITSPHGRACELDLRLTNGDIDIIGESGEHFESCFFKNVNGDVALKNVDAKSLTRISTNGDTTFSGETRADKIEVECVNGEITLENGNIYTQLLKMETTNGEIEFDGGTVYSNDITLDTNNGDIDIRLSGKRGDYSVTLETTNGDHNIVSGGNGAKRLSIETTNGDIEVGFTED